MLEQAGSIHSPNYPSTYPTNVVCRWIIRIPQDIIEKKKFIKLAFVDFSVEYHASCGYDNVSVFDGDKESSSLMGSFCGDNLPSPVYASEGQMVVKFTSDESMVVRGFNATFDFTSALGLYNLHVHCHLI